MPRVTAERIARVVPQMLIVREIATLLRMSESLVHQDLCPRSASAVPSASTSAAFAGFISEETRVNGTTPLTRVG